MPSALLGQFRRADLQGNGLTASGRRARSGLRSCASRRRDRALYSRDRRGCARRSAVLTLATRSSGVAAIFPTRLAMSAWSLVTKEAVMDDIVIRGGRVIDGTGAPARVADAGRGAMEARLVRLAQAATALGGWGNVDPCSPPCVPRVDRTVRGWALPVRGMCPGRNPPATFHRRRKSRGWPSRATTMLTSMRLRLPATKGL